LSITVIPPHLFAMAPQCQKILPLHALHYEKRYPSGQKVYYIYLRQWLIFSSQ